MAQPKKNTVYHGTFIHSTSLDTLKYLHNTSVFVHVSGNIVAIEKEVDLDTALSTVLPKLGWAKDDIAVEKIREGSQFFFPGFIDTHLHASQYPNVGIFGKSTLLDWLNRYTFPLEASLSDLNKARAVYARCIRKTLSHGTTCAAYYATVDVASTNLLADLCSAVGQRALVGRVCMDSTLSPEWYRDESAEQSLAATRESIAYINKLDGGEKGIVRPVITPRFAPSCSPGLLRALGELAAETGLPVQTHISENAGEIRLVKELFPPSLTGAKGDSYAEVYDAYGLLTDKTILAHGVHLSEGEAELISKRGAKVSHCPCSNSAITSGAARVRWLIEKGVTCGLGTDMSGGYSPSVLEAARQASLVSRHVAMGGDEGAKLSVEEVLYLATKGGAEVVGLEGKVGGFEVGMEWDAQLVVLGEVDGRGQVRGVEEGEEEDGNVDVFGWESWEERVAKWLFNGDDRNTRKVWVKGRLVHERK
ncbi:hypothetical protein GE09DRAFT_1291493 [Coniochaeta sp. 2T2.1]|nr:hypothetical protein GE09DRAFT_1291493 [Coniochaeta sp. 2T2.1]